MNRTPAWFRKEFELDAAPWHRPKSRTLAPGVTMTTIYGSHVLAALLYAAWRKVRRGEARR